ncbi:GntR family transcriptional regulator [Shigella sp. FC1967]|nr:GntR family transcriptional regulator [Shigella sp. FC1967]
MGDTLPAEKILAEQYCVSRMTIRKAIDLLVIAGLLERKTRLRDLY